MLLPLCHSRVIGLLYRVAGIAQAKLFPQGIAGDVAIVPVQVLHQPFRPLPALYKGAVQMQQAVRGTSDVPCIRPFDRRDAARSLITPAMLTPART